MASRRNEKERDHTMTPEKQRIAIAKACGYQKGWNYKSGYPADFTQEWHIDSLPDYLNDLNAMHEAEKTLSDDNLKSYRGWLVVVCNGEHWRATAAQRAEAFLRTIDKWEETE
jgi:hypothetical protein